ncbi:hypothetical protein Q8F55_003341 [Vanrija albida]|uniref:Rhodanese domain-containing protein n=1 Tax=Vanrija albida TaxID=181172 RepID=A0ABR3Q3Q0_9TREE
MATPLVISPASLPPLPPKAPVVLLDATFLFQPTPADRDPKLDFYARHLAGARFWSLKDVSEPDERFKLQFPSPERFAAAASAAGIEEDSWVIVYDSEGSFSAPRTVFTFLAFGHRRVSILDGGLPAALDAGFPLETGPVAPPTPTSYPVPTLQPGFVAPFPAVLDLAEHPSASARVVDARDRSRFAAGHMANSANVPWRELLRRVDRKGDAWEEWKVEGEDGTYSALPSPEDVDGKLVEALGAEGAAGVKDGSVTVTNSCGGGLSAAILWLSLRRDGIKSQLYDEVSHPQLPRSPQSWQGWTERQAPVEKS